MIEALAPVGTTIVAAAPADTPSTDFALLMAMSADSAPVSPPVPAVSLAPAETAPPPQVAANPLPKFAETVTVVPSRGEQDEPPALEEDDVPAGSLMQMMQMLAMPADCRPAVVASGPAAPVPVTVQSHRADKDDLLPQVALTIAQDRPRTAPRIDPTPIAPDTSSGQFPVASQSSPAALPFPVPERTMPAAPALPAYALPAIAERELNSAQTLARDLTAIAAGHTSRFDLRAEALGPLAVTITRGEEGNTLRLGVESTAAAQQIRSAETQLADLSSRTGAPFVQVSIDLSQREQRQRGPARPLARTDPALTATAATLVAPGGRFA